MLEIETDSGNARRTGVAAGARTPGEQLSQQRPLGAAVQWRFRAAATEHYATGPDAKLEMETASTHARRQKNRW